MSLEHDPIRQQRRRPVRGRFAPLLVPILDAFEIIGVGPTKGYELVGAGIIETVMVGRRRYATQEGLERIVKLGVRSAPTPPTDPKRKRRKLLGEEPDAAE